MRSIPHVFVSSTFVDLKRHRAAVREIIQKLGAHDISMETLGARDNRPLDECVRLIKEESDVFVGIYAHRYGFVPKHSRVSITEAEYDAAVERGIPRFVFLAAGNAPQKHGDGTDGSRLKMERFKSSLAAGRVLERFSSPHDLAARVAAALGRHFGQQRLDDSFGRQLTMQHIRADAADELHQFLSNLVDDIGYWLEQTRTFRFIPISAEQVEQPFNTSDAIATSLPAVFFTSTSHRLAGHQRFETLEQAFSHARRRLLLVGSPGSGKTTTLLTFARTAAEGRLLGSAALVPLVVRAATWTSNHRDVTQWLAEQIPTLKHSTIESLVAKGQALLMVDGLDEVRWRKAKEDTPPGLDPRRTLLEAIPKGGGVLISCRESDFEMLVDSGATFPVRSAVNLQSISDTDRQDMLRTRPQLAALASRDTEFDRLTRNPLMMALLLSAYEESSSAVNQFAGLDPSTLRDSVIGRFIERRLEHEALKYGGLEFELDDIYRCWGPVAMADAGGGGNVNDFDAADATSALPLSSAQQSLFVRLSHTLGLVYAPRPTRLAFTHLLFRDHFAFRQALKTLTMGDDAERDSAAWALWQIPDKRAVPLLVQALNDPYRYARGSAAGALGMIGDPEAIGPLSKLLSDTTPVHSIYGDTIADVAVWAIARIRETR